MSHRLGASAASDNIILDLYRRKCLYAYEPRRFSTWDEPVQREWMAQHKVFAERFVSDAMERELESPFRELSYFIRRSDGEGLRAFARDEVEPTVQATIVKAVWKEGGLVVDIEAAIRGRLSLPRQLICEIRSRDGVGDSAFPVVRPAEQPPEYGQPGRAIRLIAGTLRLR